MTQIRKISNYPMYFASVSILSVCSQCFPYMVIRLTDIIIRERVCISIIPRNICLRLKNILLMLRPDKKYTPFEATILDLALVLHMEHGGGNNSTFTTHVVSSSGTDTYSTIAAALGSLKGPKHGGREY